MIVVSDASPINYLLEIEHIDVLPHLFRRIIIPRAVAQELNAPRAPQRNKDWLARLAEPYQIAAPARVNQSLKLNPGELEAICLAEELHADAVLMDEAEGRHVASERGLRLIGTVGVLELAARSRLLSLDEALEKLSSTRFFLSEKIRREALDRWHASKASR